MEVVIGRFLSGRRIERRVSQLLEPEILNQKDTGRGILRAGRGGLRGPGVMGSESSALRSFTMEEPPCSLPSGVSLYRALLPEGRPASVFVYSPENQDMVNKAAKHLKTLRHPCLLRFLSCVVETDGIHLVTERVQPLEMVLENLFSEEICAGIYDILQALVFLHDRGNFAHNNISLSSIFVSEDGHWKLGGMEMVCKLTETPPESAEFGILPETHGHARDAFSFGKLVESLLAYVDDQVSADLVLSFQNTVCSCLLNPDPLCRPSLHNLLSHEFFRIDFLEVVNFLKSLTLKTEEEKNEFFKFLLDKVAGLSEDLIAFRLVPLLLNQLVFAEPAAVKSFLPHLLRPKHDISQRNRVDCLLSPALFQAHVIPIILKLFKVHEEHVRMVLLSHIDAYADLFSQEELKTIILPQVLLGLRDTSDPLVAITLHSLAVLVSFLGPEVVVGGERTKIFKSTTPSFTKTADTTPEDSPIHTVSNLRPAVTQPIKNNLANLLPKSSLSGKVFFNSEETWKKGLEETNSLGSLQTGETGVQSFLGLSMNGVDSVERDRCTLLNNSENPAEEWPDWSESEEAEAQKTLRIQACVSEQGEMSAAPGCRNAGDQAEPLVCLEAYSNSLSSASSHSSRELESQPGTKSNPVAWEHPTPAKETNNTNLRAQMASQETSAERKFGTELGLGEEFTIQILSGKRTELAETVPNQENFPGEEKNSEIVSFSSKFAAEITEVEAGGWSGDDDLNWIEDENNW
ncbi:protein-associating with the carboxyl-terminal domain of ezrin isoform X2 [Rhinatrema bivittatum]|uniref:protein-associating with the carboxyl-terminal domain of ezrin isoform X2 n=1 Tax=Rhinatrema bivittatum TaxID=194408 RepID=UPI00112D70C2|nr:protein-associating with the carboxyl-terminal domain of ezrin isoform X2 [Rhinatrema bivittatum]